MHRNNEKLNRFAKLLQSIFELDKADLDFGIYRIMNIRKEEIQKFLAVDLVQKVQETLAPFASNTDTITERIQEIEKQAADIGFDIATSKLADEYARLKLQLVARVDLSSLETDVYSALYSFFNRYYDEGDFISKRRYKEGVYAIPYEGEEVKLYWANADQYYIKTAENFRDYTFIDDSRKVHFRLVDATCEKNNNKESDTSKRVFMLYTETPEKPELKTIEEVDGELVIRFVYDVPVDARRKYAEENLAAINEAITHGFKDWHHLFAPASQAKDEKRSILEKHLAAYVAKNTFDYFIHKDLRGFLTRELDFFIKSEVLYLDDLDTTNEKLVDNYLAKIRAIKRVGKIIIDFLAQIEDFQKKLWLKKKFIVAANWCVTLDRVDERFYPEIIANATQIAEWVNMYAISEIDGNLTTVGCSEPLTEEFLRQNGNLVLDTRHFTADFKDSLIASVDNLDEQTGGVMIHGDNIQALRLLETSLIEKVDCVHIDPPYNTDTSGFLYKNNYRHSSWLSMMDERIIGTYPLIADNGSFICHIDENEYENLWNLFERKGFNATGTVIWDKRNPMTGGNGIATQHEYIIWRNKGEVTVSLNTDNANTILSKVQELIKKHDGVSDLVCKEFAAWINGNDELSSGEKAYRYINDDWRVYQSVSLRAPERRENEKFHRPLIHPVTKKPCPVPPNGFSRTPETLNEMIVKGVILFGEDESTQPRQKMFLTEGRNRQLTSVIQDATRGKTDTDKLGVYFPYNHSVQFYTNILSAATNNSGLILDYFAGSGTTGHSVLEMNRSIDDSNRRYILVEMGEYFSTVTLPRMKKVVYSADWKNGKPQNRSTGVSHLLKYITLESYEDALSNITLDDDQHGLIKLFGDDYLINYMFNTEAAGSMLNVDTFTQPFDYKLKINENNETKEKVIDICETFNYLLGLSVKRQSAIAIFNAIADPNGEYEGAVELKLDNGGEFSFKQIEGKLPDGGRALIIWRTVTTDLLKSNAALDAYFMKHRVNSDDRKFDVIYVNGDSNLENLRPDDETWKVQRMEPVFKAKMFEEAE
ncbi:MAG: site-specific DNA-methyltransferase [Candidatus Accumulibacter sp.]|nr:site-specific DNA-methyltransferase [Accumulibacter sp.]